MNKRILLLANIVLTSALVLVTGCASMTTIEPPEVTLVNLKFTEVTLFETTMIASLRLTNPNPEAFAVQGASFKLYLDDHKVGTGVTSEVFSVERLDSHVVDATFHINNASALLRIRNIVEQKDVSYKVASILYTEGTFGTKKVKSEHSGRLDLETININDKDPLDQPFMKDFE